MSSGRLRPRRPRSEVLPRNSSSVRHVSLEERRGRAVVESREAADVGEVEEVEEDRARSCRTAAPCVDATKRSREGGGGGEGIKACIESKHR